MRSPVVRSIGTFVATLVIVFGGLFGVRYLRDDGVDRAEGADRTRTVDDVAALPPDSHVAVTGYVFIDSRTGVLLCAARRQVSRRPACEGRVLVLQDLDTSRLDLVSAAVEQGGYDAWSRDRVVLQVRTARGVARVVDVLPVDG